MGSIKEYIQILEDLENLDSDIEKADYLQNCIEAKGRSERIASIIIDRLSSKQNSYYHKSNPDKYEWANGHWVEKISVLS